MVGNLAFVSFYLGFEYLTVNTNCFWPWLNLGNGLAGNISIIQWYEFTGVAGGSLWILLVNLLIFKILKRWFEDQTVFKKSIATLFAILTISVALSYWLGFANIPIKYLKDKIAIVQPNVNSYQYKLTELSNRNKQVAKDHILSLSNSLEDNSFDYIVLPETTFPTVFNLEDEVINSTSTAFLKKYLKPNGQLIYGAYATNNQQQKFNVSVFKSKANHSFHIKQKLVPGVEVMPFVGNYSNSNASSFEKKYYSSFSKYKHETQKKFPTAICYESIFGNELAAQSSYKNKPVIIITNDGWFNNTNLIQQHLNIAKLRAIENRRFVVRSANSGISAIINNTGKIVEHLPNNKAGIIEAYVPQKHLKKTFYQKYTDIVYRIGALVSLILLLYIFVANFTNNFKFKKLGFT